jgi:hypothetical protein
MQRLLWLTAVAAVGLSSTGCFINPYSSNPNRRTNELLNQSENLRQAEDEWERVWFLDQPSLMTPDRVSGAVAPGPS